MRTLKFNVEKQLIRRDPNCDFEGIVPGTEGYLKAYFSFSKEWDGCIKVVEFSTRFGEESEPQYLKDGCSCIIPSDALKNKRFRIRVIGKKKDYRITSNYVTVSQKG